MEWEIEGWRKKQELGDERETKSGKSKRDRGVRGEASFDDSRYDFREGLKIKQSFDKLWKWTRKNAYNLRLVLLYQSILISINFPFSRDVFAHVIWIWIFIQLLSVISNDGENSIIMIFVNIIFFEHLEMPRRDVKIKKIIVDIFVRNWNDYLFHWWTRKRIFDLLIDRSCARDAHLRRCIFIAMNFYILEWCYKLLYLSYWSIK